MKTAKDYGISNETLKSMKQFFLKTSIPRILEREREEVKSQCQKDERANA